ncbi:MAG TPA: hypothetical protein VJ873_14100, partial [bacterium]|nr:hypothetical protein [bacterium]
LQNTGYVLSPSVSTDGVSWTPLPTPSYNLSGDTPSFNGATLICGLVVWNETTGSPSTAVFGNVCVGPLSGPAPTSSPTPPWTATPSATPSPTSSPLSTFTPTPTPGRFVWPNPFTPQLPTDNTAHFNLPSGHGAGKFLIADLKRRKVRSVDFSAGQDAAWDGRDDDGNLVASGVYLYLLESDGTVHRGTVTVLR